MFPVNFLARPKLKARIFPRLLTQTVRNALVAALSFGFASAAQAAGKQDEVRIDFACDNPVSLVLKEKGWLEESLAKDGVKLRWAQSKGWSAIRMK